MISAAESRFNQKRVMAHVRENPFSPELPYGVDGPQDLQVFVKAAQAIAFVEKTAAQLLLAAILGISGLGCLKNPDDEQSCAAEEEYPPFIDYSYPENFALPTESTFFGDNVAAAAKKATSLAEISGGKGLDYFRAVDKVVHDKLTFTDNDAKILSRTADEVLSDGDASGCHDYAITAAALLRYLGYPVVFVDSVGVDTISGKESGQGHAFLEVFDRFCENGNGCWHLYDPTFSTLYTDYDRDNYSLPNGYVVFAKGDDYWSMGLESSVDLMVCLDSFANMFGGQKGYEVADYEAIKL